MNVKLNMKTILFAACFLFATSAFAQSAIGSLSSQVSSYTFVSHPQRADFKEMGRQQSLFDSSGYTYARGERPLWEVAPDVQAVPLGDIARDLRKEHETAKKATATWQNY
jgi:hypothetical protein